MKISRQATQKGDAQTFGGRRFSTNAKGVIDWKGDTLLYGNIKFSMPQLRSTIHGMIVLQIDSEGTIESSVVLSFLAVL
jgi:hypothetical protein